MEWITRYPAHTQPEAAQIAAFIQSPLWDKLHAFLQTSYDVQPSYAYSACSGQPGWNVKYQKAGRALCTLYPMDGFFIAMVVIGKKELVEAELLMPTCTPHVQEVFRTAGGLAGARWMMIHVTDDAILEDVQQLIQLRRKVKK